MARNSLRASQKGITTIKALLKRKKWNQTFFAGRVGCTRQTIWSLLKGNSIDADVFLNACELLELSEDDITDNHDAELIGVQSQPIDEIVQVVRSKTKPWVNENYGWMNILGMHHRIGLNDIYTDIDFLEHIEGRRRLSLKELSEIYPHDRLKEFGFNHTEEERVKGLDAIDKSKKVVIFGSPGAGKTTFLKRVIVKCAAGEIYPDRVPMFVTLKQFAKIEGSPNLLTYIEQQLLDCQIEDPESTVIQLLREGRILLLLDGLDEVASAERSRVIEEIREFSSRFHNNLYVLTCRLAVGEFKLEAFDEVQISEFDDRQITVFVTKWFHKEDPELIDQVLHYLDTNHRIRELTTNPLLLTLFCLVFEAAGYFSDSRSEIYKEGLNVLLKRWDVSRGIDRDQIYKKLTPDRKEDLLSELARITFDKGEYFFKEITARNHISDYLSRLPGISNSFAERDLNSHAVLKSIGLQHGLLMKRSRNNYSFSHLTFHEYFVARGIVRECSSTDMSDKVLLKLLEQITDKNWREVFLLVAEMLSQADSFFLMMKRKIDSLVEKDRVVQKFLYWLKEKTTSIHSSYKPGAVRAFYIYSSPHFRDYAVELACKLDSEFNRVLLYTSHLSLDLDLALDADLDLDLDLIKTLARARALEKVENPGNALALARSLESSLSRAVNNVFSNSSHAYAQAQALNISVEFETDIDLNSNTDRVSVQESAFEIKLQRLKSELPDPDLFPQEFNSWWISTGTTWTNDLINLMIEYRKIGMEWQFDESTVDTVQGYLQANSLLIDCLKLDCCISPDVREFIEKSLLLAVSSQPQLAKTH